MSEDSYNVRSKKKGSVESLSKVVVIVSGEVASFVVERTIGDRVEVDGVADGREASCRMWSQLCAVVVVDVGASVKASKVGFAVGVVSVVSVVVCHVVDLRCSCLLGVARARESLIFIFVNAEAKRNSQKLFSTKRIFGIYKLKISDIMEEATTTTLNYIAPGFSGAGP